MKGLKNVHTILTDYKTHLPDASIDIVLLFYVLHDFKNPDLVITELDRVLKPMGLLSVIDHKFDKDKVVSTVRHATQGLKLIKSEVQNDKRKSMLLIFTKV
jgi:ubiquinone/menaquinone biosynthesis C-methylase UbiE